MRRTLITGATSGLGKALCQHLAKKKDSLILTGRNQQQLDLLAHELQTDVQTLALDLSHPAERKRLIGCIHQQVPDLVINNAGFGLYGDALSHEVAQQMEILEVNGNAVLEITLEAAHSLKQAGKPGVILNISSAAAFFVAPTFAVYSAAKAFVNQFSLGLDRELKPYGIRILTACPGQIATGFRARASCGFPQKEEGHTMSIETAVHELLWQIEKKKRLHVFDARYRLATFVARHFLPSRVIEHLFRHSLKSRHRA